MSYTRTGNQKVEQKIQGELDAVVDYLKRELRENLYSVVLVGGFGRGEGSVWSKDNKIVPYNDYDLVLITHENISRTSLLRWKKELMSSISVRLLDTINYRYSQILTLPLTMFNYDMKYGGTVLYGPPDLLRKLPEYPLHQLPLEEVRRLLVNRLVTFLEAYPLQEALDNFEKRSFSIRQAAKANLAAVDTLLVCNNLYEVQYEKKIKTYIDRTEVSAEFSELAVQSLQIKLGDSIPQVEPDVFWERSRKFFVYAIEQCFHTMYGETLDISSNVYKQLLQFIPERYGRKGKVFKLLYGLVGQTYENENQRVEKAELLLVLYYSNFTKDVLEYIKLTLHNGIDTQYAGGKESWRELTDYTIKKWYEVCHF